MRFLTPTENKRLNELVGFVCIMTAVLLGLALISYSPHDPAFNVSAASINENPVRNWIGPVGSYTADLSFQVFGFAAFLLPVAMGILGYRWFRSRAVDSQWATLVGYGLLLLSLPSLLSMIHFPDVRGAIPAGGLLGGVVSHGLQSGFNFWGAVLVALAILIVALFLTTSFSFSGAHAWASSSKGPLGKVGKFGILQRARARWEDWRDAREEARMRREVEERKLSGRKPVTPQIVGRGEKAESETPKTIRLEAEGDIFPDPSPSRGAGEKHSQEMGHKAPVVMLGPDKIDKARKAEAEDCQGYDELSVAIGAIVAARRRRIKAGRRRIEAEGPGDRGEVPRIWSRRAGDADQSGTGGDDV